MVVRRTKADNERIEFAKLYMSCLPCLIVNFLNSHADFHHVVEGRKRLGPSIGYGNCLWHHRGINWEGMTTQEMIGCLGPSIAHGKKSFQHHFGNERILVQTVEFAHKLFLQHPWNEFAMPRSMGSKIRRFHLGKQ